MSLFGVHGGIDISDLISQKQSLSTPRGRAKSEGSKKMEKTFLALKKLKSVQGEEPWTLKVIGTPFLIKFRDTYLSFAFYFYNEEYHLNMIEAHYKVDPNDAWKVDEDPVDYDETKLIPDFLDILYDLPEDLRAYLVSDIGHFAEHQKVEGPRRVYEKYKIPL